MSSYLLCVQALALLLSTGQAAHIKHSLKGCEFEGRVHLPGSRFTPNACTACHCPQDGGEAKCIVQDCSPVQHCIKYNNNTDECCQQCQEYGCRHSDGQLFRQGEVIRNEACVRCYCPVGGGNPVCDVTECPLSQCVDPVKVPGVCCPVCPNGPNCQIGLLTLPIGKAVNIEGATCVCETFEDVEGLVRTLARCNKGQSDINSIGEFNDDKNPVQ